MNRSLLLRRKRVGKKALSLEPRALKDMAKAVSVERAAWGSGPWDNERDRLEFRAHGFDCLMVRNHVLGFWCGYVALPVGHPWYDMGYNDIPVEAHGGLTYKEACRADICHKGDGDAVQWIGFDCGHVGDLAPYTANLLGPAFSGLGDEYRDTYRTESWVSDECRRIAQQAQEARV